MDRKGRKKTNVRGKGANLKTTTTTKTHTHNNKTMGFPDSTVGKESACDDGDPGSIGGEGKGIVYPLHYSLVVSW